MKHLFTYGSLKPGGRFYPQIQDYVLEPRPAMIGGELYDTGNGWPAIKLVDGVGKYVLGIDYRVRVEDWDRLVAITDGIEGYPNLFERTYVATQYTDKFSYTHEALVYFGNVESLFRTRIESGEWVIE